MENQTERQFAEPVRHSINVVTLSCILGLVACGTATKQNTIPSDGPTMAEIYRQHIIDAGVSSSRSARERIPLRDPQEVHQAPFMRTAIDEVDNRFVRLPNPDLVMYVAPHLAAGKYPVPGYTTVFPMYETVEYAMPGEVQTRKQQASALK